MLISLYIVAALLILFVLGKMNLSIKFSVAVQSLFSQSKNISEKQFHVKTLVDLPLPVQRYFKYVVKEGQPFISYARIRHDGQFKTGLKKSWMNIKGEQYATTERPGFIWKGVTNMFVARDMYIAEKGRLCVTLFSIYNVVDAKGPKYDQGEILRWLGESLLYPTNLLPSERLQWVAIDDQSAKLTFNYNGLSLFFIVRFNAIGEIIEMETERYMGEDLLTTWIIKPTNYRLMNDMRIPVSFRVIWRLAEEDFCYAKFNIIKVEYDNPSLF